MKVIIIACICIIGVYGLSKFIKNLFLYSIIEKEYKDFKKLTFNYPTQRLTNLQQDLNRAIALLKKIIKIDESTLQEQKSKEDIEIWTDTKQKNEVLLHDFENKLEEVNQELNRRDFFHSKW